MSGHVARAWHRRRRDRRLGYSALGLGAGGFVLVLTGTLLVTEVVPGLLDEPEPAQRVVPASELQPAPQQSGPDGGTDPLGTTTVVAVFPGPVIAPVSLPDDESAGDEPDGDQPGGTPGQPQPQPQPQPEPQPEPEPPAGQGAASALLDPVVQAVTGTADGVTGGATAPVTGPVGGVVDGATDVVDGLLGSQ